MLYAEASCLLLTIIGVIITIIHLSVHSQKFRSIMVTAGQVLITVIFGVFVIAFIALWYLAIIVARMFTTSAAGLSPTLLHACITVTYAVMFTILIVVAVGMIVLLMLNVWNISPSQLKGVVQKWRHKT